MLTLYLLRHAKSAWDRPGRDDHERTLARRGEEDAPLMGAYMAAHGLIPERILCSTAVRTQATLALIRPYLEAPTDEDVGNDGSVGGDGSGGCEIPTFHYGEIYESEAPLLLDVLQRQDAPETPASLLMVGHNPGLQHLALKLVAGAGDSSCLRRLIVKYPTCALAEIEIDADHWGAVGTTAGRLVRFETPKRIAANSGGDDGDHTGTGADAAIGAGGSDGDA